MLASVKQRFPKEYRAALKIKEYVQEEMGASANQDELLYLTLHISKGVLNEENIGCTIYKDLLVVLRLLIPWKILLTVRR